MMLTLFQMFVQNHKLYYQYLNGISMLPASPCFYEPRPGHLDQIPFYQVNTIGAKALVTIRMSGSSSLVEFEKH